MGRKSDARQRILTGAVRLFSDRGYAGAAVDDLLAEAGVGKSSFYHFFETKAALGAAATSEWELRVDQEILSPAFDEGVEPLDRPLRLVDRLSRAIDEQTGTAFWLIGTNAACFGSLPAEMRERTEAVLDRLQTPLARAFSQARDEMDLTPDADPGLLAQACAAYLHGVLLLCRVKGSSEPMRRLGPLMVSFWRPFVV
ncbi:MAG: TetR/AcrR family transcriptional regulator [Armatimonadetes bacterium]|nr:TetR/AcrR family transcriptional regulator [Fimbriimonadia bacterium ATM]NOG92998.1 TetR/AcrR family transcriptional regulator [Armatimonadota bacterium]